MSSLLCVDVGGTWIKSAVVHDGQVGPVQQHPAPRGDAAQLLDALAGLVLGHADQATGWSLALPGTTTAQRYWQDSAAFALMGQQLDLQQECQQRGVPMPLNLCNDVFAAARGEALAHPDPARMLVVNIGTGLAACLIQDGWPVAGVMQESGHITYRPDGRLCGCGRHGCYEALVGWKALQQLSGAREPAALHEALTAEQRDEALAALAAYVAALLAISGAEHLVVTGGTWQGFYADHAEALQERSSQLYLPARPATWLPSEGRPAVMRGLYDLAVV